MSPYLYCSVSKLHKMLLGNATQYLEMQQITVEPGDIPLSWRLNG